MLTVRLDELLDQRPLFVVILLGLNELLLLINDGLSDGRRPATRRDHGTHAQESGQTDATHDEFPAESLAIT